jgi:hypothetical protein
MSFNLEAGFSSIIFPDPAINKKPNPGLRKDLPNFLKKSKPI